MTVMPHWSASRFMAWDQCPGEFKARYIDGRPFDMTEAVAFGQAVHLGLEAHFGGEDAIRAFRAAWKAIVLEHLLDVDPNLTRMGMDLIEQVLELGLAGVPEREFSIEPINDVIGAPIVGYVDLWGADNVIYDFKTTRGLWSQERAQKEFWQPALYTLARFEADEAYEGTFEYIVMNRITGELQRFRREWSADELVGLWGEAWARMEDIARHVRDDQYLCGGKHGFCPECGDRWAHDHSCIQNLSLPRVRVR